MNERGVSRSSVEFFFSHSTEKMLEEAFCVSKKFS